MDLTSAPLHKRQVSWRGLLLTALVLTFWNAPTAAQLSVEAIPPHVGEGEEVYFLAQNLPNDVSSLSWIKGRNFNMSNLIIRLITNRSKIENGRLYSGRETIHTDGSLNFKNVTKTDSGTYLLYVTLGYFDEVKARLQLYVHDPVTKPSIEVTNTTIKGVVSVFLKCLSNNTGISIHWFVNNQPLEITDRMRLSENNSTLQIDQARSEDSGDYHCEVSNGFLSKKSDNNYLDIIDQLTQPSIEVTNTTVKDRISVFLTCLSNDTGISIHWLFKGKNLELRDRMKLSQDNRTLQIDSVGIEDSGAYQCEVSNQVSSMRSDPIQLDIIKEPRKSKRLSIIAIVAQCLLGLIAVIFVVVFLWRSSRGRQPQVEKDTKQVDNEQTNLNEPTKLNETSKAPSIVKPQKPGKK